MQCVDLGGAGDQEWDSTVQLKLTMFDKWTSLLSMQIDF